jgi:hypothetical protein
MPADILTMTNGAKQPDAPGGEGPWPPRPDGVRADRTADAAADQHDGTDTWKQATDAAGRLRAARDVPEPDSLGG